MRLIAYTHLDYPADVKKIQALSYAELLMVNFSAITEESFKRVHGAHTSMKRVLKNMDRLLAIRDKYGKPKIRLSFVVYNHNYKELAGFLDMAHERNIDQVVVRFFEATEEMKQLVSRNSQFYEAIENYITETQGNFAWQRFQEIIYKPREKLPDRMWINQIGQYLGHNPVFFSKFKETVGYEDDVENYVASPFFIAIAFWYCSSAIL